MKKILFTLCVISLAFCVSGNGICGQQAKDTPAKDYLEIGSKLLANESVGGLKTGISADEAEKIAGAADVKSKPEKWEADGMTHQNRTYKKKGIVLDFLIVEKKASVSSIEINKSCELKTSRNIGIGSERKEVEKAYANEIDPEASSADDSRIVAGSVYGGIIFNFEKGRVSSIFIGAAAE